MPAIPDDDATLLAGAIGALTVSRFCALFGVGRTYAYAEIKARRLRARKAGDRTLISVRDAQIWLQSLPVLDTLPTRGGRRKCAAK